MTQTLRERYGYLPHVLRLVLEAAGESAMMRLWTVHGGIRVFPITLRQTMPVEAEAIIKMMRKEHLIHIDVPTMIHALHFARQRRIEEFRSEGMPIAEIARTVGMSERGVSRALARARARRGETLPPRKIARTPQTVELEHRA